ncbi:MAG: hypothetical protein GY867_02270 [bacterium]|nr:hypothetical protein [bacterium]
MKFPAIIGILLVLGGAAMAAETSLAPEEQQRIIDNYMFVTGQSGAGSGALSDDGEHAHDGYKCGTPAVLEFYRNLDRMDRGLLAALGVEFASRPVMSFYYDPPGDEVRIHYETDPGSPHTVWEANVDNDSDGVPDYVEAVALAADSAFDHIFANMGYKRPIPDTSCAVEDDPRLDIYLTAMSFGYYGVTYNDTLCTGSGDIREAAVWIEIDHDFQHLPEYVNNPLAAAQVTLAHEIFHASHFAMDATEDIVWYEMSAVWMEEQQYDEINDYYLLLPIFYSDPRWSIQSDDNVHHYASVVFPIYLSEVYGPEIIKFIWDRSGSMPGHNFLFSIDQAIDSASHAICDTSSADTCYTASLASALRDFSIWNYFTGPYADQAPEGIGFSEAANYDYFPLESMARHSTYPDFVSYNENPFRPQYNSSSFIRFENLESLVPEDTLLSIYVFALDTVPGLVWGVSAICQSRVDPDRHDILRDTTSDWNFLGGGMFLDSILGLIDAREYRAVTVVFTPATPAPSLYSPTTYLRLGYAASLETAELHGPSVLSPYPNPAVVAEMGGAPLTFRFQYPTVTVASPLSGTAVLLVDLYTVAGEYVRSLGGDPIGEDVTGNSAYRVFEIGWDMKNQSGRDVASGVYLAYARLYEGSERTELLAEDKVKVAVIR